MSSLTDAARESLSPLARRASRRARLAPYVSALFAGLAAAVLILFVYQAGLFGALAPTEEKPPETLPPEQITISRSTITGFDKQNQPYSVTALSAIQDKDVPSRVHLDTIDAESKRANGEVVKIKAKSGLYDTEIKTLDLAGAVEIRSEGRFIAYMDKARVIVRERTLVTNSPVNVEMPNGTIAAKALRITNDGNNILFFNGVRAKFKSKGAKGDTTP